ncbi:MAG: HAD family hydrolase [Bacilli bacterium]|jgi:phosphoglycolate phosphatase|nr:HAD family hydrolase [Bacilli bacterium]
MDNNAKLCLIFDLDGTLWDALKGITIAWNAAMAREGQTYFFTEAIMRNYMGLTPEETGPLAFPNKTLAEQMRLFRSCLKSEIDYLGRHPGVLYPFEKEVLAELGKTYDLYIVSNSDKGYVENYLRACGTGRYFKGHVCAGDTDAPKWRNIRYIMEKNSIERAAYIGDTEKDRRESKVAGIPFIWAAYGFGVRVNARHLIRNLTELPQVAKSVFEE